MLCVEQAILDIVVDQWGISTRAVGRFFGPSQFTVSRVLKSKLYPYQFKHLLKLIILFAWSSSADFWGKVRRIQIFWQLFISQVNPHLHVMVHLIFTMYIYRPLTYNMRWHIRDNLQPMIGMESPATV